MFKTSGCALLMFGHGHTYGVYMSMYIMDICVARAPGHARDLSRLG